MEFVIDSANYKEGSFMWAVEQMKRGNKVRRPIFSNGNFLYMDDYAIMNNIPKSKAYFSYDHFTSSDWEIFRIKKTLSDNLSKCGCCDKLNRKSIKKSLREFIDWLVPSSYPEHTTTEQDKIIIKAKEIFGVELL